MPNVIIAPQLFQALGKLSPQEQARANAFITTFIDNPASPGISLERITGARSASVWSGRVTRDLRAILHKDGDTWALLHVDHHDAAYAWAQRREIGRHTITGALQVVEAVETVREVERIIEVHLAPDAPPVFAAHSDDYLLSLGVPVVWLPTLRQVRDDEQLLVVCDKLPNEIAERLFDLADGELVTPPAPIPPSRPITDAVDTRYRFYVTGDDVEGLLAALQSPLDRWIAFLHPAQRAMVERAYSGPAKVSGSAGTGKTVVAMQRARHLARTGERVLLTSFVTTLCENIERNLGKLCTEQEQAQITVSTVHKVALSIVRRDEPGAQLARDDDMERLLHDLHCQRPTEHDLDFVRTEWNNVVRLQGIQTWAEYRRARRTGRGQPLSVTGRKALWQVFGGVLDELRRHGRYDWPGLCRRAEELLLSGQAPHPYTAVVVDEVQDLKPPALRFLRALSAPYPGNLMLCGDTGQRIYPGGFSLSALGIEVRGRAAVLRINYRTTEQIRRLADRVVGDEADDMQGGRESRRHTRSLLHGPRPVLRGSENSGQELQFAVEQVQSWLAHGRAPEAIALFARTHSLVESIEQSLEQAGIPTKRLSDARAVGVGAVNLGNMHRAKGLEFEVVHVLCCGDDTLPLSYALQGLSDPQDIETATAQEQRLLYVAMTRARDELVVSWTGRPSRFLAPLLRAQTGEQA